MNIIATFITTVLNETGNALKKISLGKLSNSEVSAIYINTGFDLTNFERIIDNYAIKHTFRKHGNHKTEQLRGQIGVQQTDFELIPLIINMPDKIENGGENNIGRDILLTSKEINNKRYFLAEEIRINKKELALQTLYIRPIKQKTTLL